ncbi:MAG: prolyl oligopeptidase family serine peptidase [Candidatus Cloacimonetes bacterium]|nr:prolyl oligopeptidase family serine peptidase [Candidatus Cloacimonadota bacterium]
MQEFIILLVVLLILPALVTADGYKTPSSKIQEIYDIPPLPYMQFIKYEPTALEKEYSNNITLADLAREELGLAGEKIDPAINGVHDNYPETVIRLVNLENGSKLELPLPEDIRIMSTSFSPDRKLLALVSEEDDGIYLGIYDLERNNYRELKELRLNDALDIDLQWFNDNRHLLAKTVPADRDERPSPPKVPEKPVIQETYGKTSQTRTYTNLLQNSFDEQLFDYFFTSQPVVIDAVKMKYKKIGKPGIYSWLELSPDNNYILVSEILKPFSRELPWYRFPRQYIVWNKKGKNVRLLSKRPLSDQIPIGGVYNGKRSFEWQPQMAASLIWAEALDEGDPKNEVEFCDKLMLLEDIENGEAREFIKLQQRYRYIQWSEKPDWFIVYEYDRDKLWQRAWLTNLSGAEPYKIDDRSIQDQYNFPGSLLTRKNEYNQELFIHQDNHVYYLNNKGASPEGRFPYLAKVNLLSAEKDILFKCREGWLESPVCFIDENLKKIAVSSQNQDSPRNYYIYDTESKEIRWLTEYQNPYPEWANLPKEIIHYERADSVMLSAALYLPSDWDGITRLPLVLNAYPEEYTDLSTAGQSNKSADTFTYFSGASIRYFALAGYAVLADASIPIIGDPETVNETFISQTCLSVEAAINHLTDKGVIDPRKVGITGHSYGAFMVANVLAHSDLCQAGIAKSGAYNRTLTPFGFQSERRTLWEAKDFYVKVSPFMHAEKIKQPLLLIHGEEDDNSGTYPIQSKRLYDAIKGNGGIAKLVMLPLEKHGYSARESNLHVITEMIQWFDRFVKNAEPVVTGDNNLDD